MSFEFASTQLEEGVFTLRLDRPDGNLLHIEMLEEMNEALLQVKAECCEGKVLVIRGTPEVFSRGIDLLDHQGDRSVRLMNVFHRVFETLRSIPLIQVAAVEGPAVGGGFQLALGCNLIVASDAAIFALPEIKSGVLPITASVHLPRAAPRRKAMEWILLGEEIPVEDLERAGVVNRIWPAESFEEELSGFLRRLTQHSGAVLQLAKRAQVESYYTTYEDALYRVEKLYWGELMATEDAREGIAAHLEHRPAVWSNR